MRELNPDGTLKGYEFSEGYDPESPPTWTPVREDSIDFCCSPIFVRHYAEQGLTKDYPSDFYLQKKTEQPREYEITYYTGRYTELPAIGRFEQRLKEMEEKLKGRGGDRYNEYLL